MKTGLSCALTLGSNARPLSPEAELAERVRMVLETRPGSLPHRPDFGCRLDEVIGQMATAQAISQTKTAVSSALQRWLPDVELGAVTVRVVPRGATFGGLRLPEIPIAERALLALGTQADLEIGVEIRSTDPGSVVRTTLSL
ncbi:MAG: phage baseplate assembly protein W [Myxococcota bacterium]|jgi:phage baseplate assembly protein W